MTKKSSYGRDRTIVGGMEKKTFVVEPSPKREGGDRMEKKEEKKRQTVRMRFLIKIGPH